MNQLWTWITGAIGHLVAALKSAAGAIVGKVLAFFGLTIVSFEAVLPNLKAFILQFAAGLPVEVMNFLGAIGFGQAISMVFSALTVRLGSRIFIVPTSVANQLRGIGQ